MYALKTAFEHVLLTDAVLNIVSRQFFIPGSSNIWQAGKSPLNKWRFMRMLMMFVDGAISDTS